MTELARQCWFLTGPTASGKSAVGHELATRLGAEIIALDSMSLYRGMDLGTAKPSQAARAQVPHHLVDIAAPSEEFSLAQYAAAAAVAADEIRGRGRAVLFVGGTPLYLKVLLRGMFVGPPADHALRERLLAEAAEQRPGYLHARLAAVDPVAAERLQPADTRRLIRALEVYEKTGRPISQWQRQFAQAVPRDECRVFVLDWPRDALYARIERRVDEMFAAGLVEEVRQLLATGPLSRTAGQAVGYREVSDYLQSQPADDAVVRASARLAASEPTRSDDGLKAARQGPTHEQTMERVKLHTRQLAKRQLTWFRSLSECRWITLSEDCSPARVAAAILAAGSGEWRVASGEKVTGLQS